MTAEIPHRIHNKNSSSPVLKENINFMGDLGVFEIFKGAPIRHGFQWKKINNISYTREETYPNIEALQAVRQKVVDFTNSLGMNGMSAVLAHAIPGETSIIDIDNISVLEDNGVQGLFTPEGNAFFTIISGLPLYSVLADCTQTIFCAERDGLSPVVGLIHSGREEADDQFPFKAIRHAVEIYNIDPKNIKLGISPSLEPEHHEIMAEDFSRVISNASSWQPYTARPIEDGPFYLDVRSYVADQFIDAGVPPKNIELYLKGTYESTDEIGSVISYRRSKQQHIPMSCPGIAVELA